MLLLQVSVRLLVRMSHCPSDGVRRIFLTAPGRRFVSSFLTFADDFGFALASVFATIFIIFNFQ